jgi:hypothetical protein
MTLLRSARLTLKQHRFEVGFALIAAIVAGAGALWVNAKLAPLDIPGKCYPLWLSSAPDLTPACSEAISLFQQINGTLESVVVLVGLGVLPFVVGLVAGVSVVGRELELRTAQTAWGLAASRRRWFWRQLWPILVVLGLAMAFAATAASLLVVSRDAYYFGVLDHLGLQGPLLVARAFAALGLGLVAGAVLGRALPALIVGALASFGLLFIQSTVLEDWVRMQPRVELEYAFVGNPMFNGRWDRQAWRAADGRLVDEFEAMNLVPPEGQIDQYAWLADHGYKPVAFGITAETLRQWEPMEIAATVLIGLVLVLGTVAVIDEKRPT